MSPGTVHRFLRLLSRAAKALPLIAILLAIYLLWIGRGSETIEEVSEVRTPVVTAFPEYQTLKKDLRLGGYVESESIVTILPLVSGVLKEIKVDVGDAVDKDQIVALLDDQRYMLQLKQAEAAFLAAESTYTRVEKLYNSNATSQQGLDEARSQYDAASSQYELAKLQLAYTKVQSPIDGVVIKKHLNTGAIASPERPLLTVGELKSPIVRINVPEKYYSFFARRSDSLPVSITRSESETYSGSIKGMSPIVSAQSKNFEVTCSINEPGELLRPGMYVTVIFTLEERTGSYGLPYTALVSDQYLWYVDEGKAYRMEYSPGFMGEKAFLVPSDLSNREFIIEGQHFLQEGQSVEPRPE